MCDCFHLAFPNWQAASGNGAGRRLRAPEPGTEDDSTCDDPSQFTERPRPQGSSPVEEFPEREKYPDSDKECEAERNKSGSGKKSKRSGLGSMFEKRSTPKMSKLKEVHSPESGVMVKTAQDGCAEGLVYGGGGREGIFIKEVVPESPASKSMELKEGDQILSATVYFDNMSYEDAVQILEHAQAYKVKLCLKRKPDAAEAESAFESDVIPEEDVYAPEMREQGKSKRRGEARISWPKFPSFGKGRKSRFTRSHSSSEADEQRKLELSPTTSDTESPIKSQDALKGKKKHKIKLSGLTKRGRMSSSEDQDTDAPTSVQMISPEGLESPSDETPQVYVTEDLKVVEDLRRDPELQTVQHKVELISIAGTLKTEDLTVALAGQESPSGIKSPDGKKKKKKELSQLKIKIMGKDKSHKKDVKLKSSPKRLKTLGASIETEDQPEKDKSHVIPSFESYTKLEDQLALGADTPKIDMSAPKVELEIFDVALIQKGEEKTKKGKSIKQKQDPTFKLPKIGFSDVASEETIPKAYVNVEEGTIKIEQLTTEGTEVKEDPYERLSKSGLFLTKLPKREDIEIPGMEDMSKRTTAKRIKEPKTVFTGHHKDIQAETVQMLIDVDSVKEAVSKLPGFKLPKVDTSGMPIPEEITVIDANAQRISVKTPTKTKHDAQLSKFDVTASPEVSKTTIKLPKITPAGLASEELLVVTQVDVKKTVKEYNAETKQSNKEVYKREHILIPGREGAQEVALFPTEETQDINSEYISAATFKTKRAKTSMPSFEIAKPDIKIPGIGIHLPKQNISEQNVDSIKGERTIFLQEEEMSKPETRDKIGGVVSGVQIPEIDGIEYIDSADGSPAKTDGGVRLTSFGINLDVDGLKADVSCPDVGGKVEAEKQTFKLPKFGAVTPISENVPDENEDMKTLEMEDKGGKFKMPNLGISMPKVKIPKIDFSLSKEAVDVPLPEGKVKLPKAHASDIALGTRDVSNPEFKVKPLRNKGDLDGQGDTFKMPESGVKMPKIKGPEFDLSLSKKSVDFTLPQAKAEVKLPYVEHAEPGIKVEGKAPEIAVYKQDVQGSPSKFQLPQLGVSTPNVSVELPDMDKDIKIDGAEIKFPDEGSAVDIIAPSIDIEGPSMDMKTKGVEQDGKGSQYKMPTLGFSLPKVKGPKIDFKKDIEVKSPETKVDVKLPEVDLGKVDVSPPEAKMELKKPEMDLQFLQSEEEVEGEMLKITKFGIKMPKVKGTEFDLSSSKKDFVIRQTTVEVKLPEAPNIDASLGKAEVLIPEAKMEFKTPEVKMKPLQTEGDLDIEGHRGKFQMPKFGMTMPKVKGPEFDFSSKKDVDIALPEAKAEVNLPNVELKDSSAKVEIEAPEIEAQISSVKESPSKFKLPTFKFPTYGATTPNVSTEVPDIDMNISVPHTVVDEPEVKAEVNLPEVHVKKPSVGVVIEQPGVEVDAKLKKPRFSMPKFSFSKPSVKAPAVDASLQGKVEVKRGEVELPECEVEDEESKFKMPKFGISMPKVTGPEIDLSLSKKDVDVTLPEATAKMKLPNVEIKEPEVEIKAPELNIGTKGTEGSPSKYKMPTFKLPKFGVGSPSATIERPHTDKDIKINGANIKIPEKVISVDIAAPSIDIEGPSIEREGKGSKFKLPSLGFSAPQIKGPEIDLSLSKKDVDVTLPEARADVKLPDVKLKESSAEVEIKAPEIDVQTSNVEGSSAKFKMPTFTLPTFGSATPKVSVEVPDMDKYIKVEVTAPSIDTEGLSVDMKAKGSELEGPGSKFKMPKFGISIPKVKGPEIDLSFSKKDVDVTLPEAKADVKLPDVKLKESSAEVEIKAPEINIGTKGTEGSPSKFKMPTFKLPRFGVSSPSATIEVPDKDVKIDGADIKTPKEVISVDIAAPSIDIEGPSIEREGKGSKFKLPSLGFSGPQIKGPEIDLSLSKKDVDVTLPEAKADVKLPDVKLKESSAEVEIKAPEIKIGTKGTEGSPSKYKMPTFKLPKFGVGSPSATIEGPHTDKDIKFDGANIEIPEKVISVDIAAPSIDIEGPSIEREGKGSKFKLPSLGFSGPQIKGPGIDLSLSKKDVDVTLPEAKADVKLPDVKLKESSAEVEIKAPDINIGTKGTEGSPSKFKMPTFKFPKFGVSRPSATIEVPDKDVKIDGADIKTPKEVISVDIAAPSIDIEGPSIEREGKGSKFKLPSLGFSGPQIKGPEIDLSLSKKDVDVTLPEARADVKLPDVKLKESSAQVEIKAPGIDVQTSNVEGSSAKFKMPTFTLPKFGSATPKVSVEVPDVDKDIKVEVTAPSIDTEGLSVDMKAKGSEQEGPGSKFKMPKFGISMPKVKGPEIDLSLSKKDVDVTLPEAKADVKLPDVKLKESSAEVEIKAPEIDVQTSNVQGSSAKFKMPTFTLPKFGSATPKVSVEVPDVDKDIKVEVTAPSIDTEGLSVDMKAKRSEQEGPGSKFKMPKFGISMPKVKGPEIDLSFSKKDVDVTLPEAKAEVQLPDVKIKQPSATVEIKAPEIEAKTGNLEASPSKLKMPTFTLPKFGSATTKVSVEVPDVDKELTIDGSSVDVTAPSIDTEGLSVDMKAKESELEGPGSKFKMPRFGISIPKVKGPEIDLSFSKKDVDVTLPEAKAEVKLPSVEVKEPEAIISAPDAPTVEIENKMKRPNWTFPKFSFSRTSGKAPDIDVSLETPKDDVTPTDAQAEAQGPSGPILIEEPAEPDTNLKKTTFSLPGFSFSKSSIKEPEVSAELPCVDVSLSEGQVIVKQPEMQIKAPEHEAKLDGQGSKFKFPKFGIALPKAKGPGENVNASEEDAGITWPEVKAEVKLPQIEVKEPPASVEIKASETKDKSKDVGGSPLKLKMPTLKIPKFGAAAYDVAVEAPDADAVAESDGAKLQEDVTVNIKGPSVGMKTDESQAAITDSETPNTDTDAVVLGSPSKFKLQSFKMPMLSFSRPDPEEKRVPVHTECKEDQQEIKVESKEESKSLKVTFTPFGEILKRVDADFEVPKAPEHLDTSKEGHETEEPRGQQSEARAKETKQETVKSPEKTGWFKFPKFGRSSPSEPVKDAKDAKSPVEETADEETSPSCSVQSSDAFADISSAMTSEHGGPSLSSPTKVTVKYSDPSAAAGLGELHSHIITSTTRTERISVEPNLPEKVNILSSGASSSSEETLRLKSGRIHVITSNIQATPEAQRAELLTAVQIQSAGGPSRGLGVHEAASWPTEDSQGGKKTLFERRFVSETSSERSESKETIVITKQITRRFESSEPVSGDTASSVQRLRDSVHSDKMRFFDGADE